MLSSLENRPPAFSFSRPVAVRSQPPRQVA